MDKKLKLQIKSEVKQIVDEIEYEENQFNRMFHSNVEFQKSYYKFLKIYEKYGKEAYLRYVPFKFKKQEIRNLIKSGEYLQIFEHYGLHTIQKLQYTYNLTSSEFNTTNKFKLLIIKLKKLFSSNFISLPNQTILALPPAIGEFNPLKKDCDL